MAKLLLLVVGLVLVYVILKGYRRGVDRPAEQRTVVGDDMVRCEQCGVHLPRGESVTVRGRYFCSPEHQRRCDGQ